MNRYDLLEELALANAEALFELWGLEYKRINNDEYDFLNPTRNDKNFGACRFNVKKGKGADFAGINFSKVDLAAVGLNFDKDDFVESKSIQTNWGFNIIGLCMRLHGVADYKDAAKLIHSQLNTLKERGTLYTVTEEAIAKKQKDALLAVSRKIEIAKRTWDSCRPITDTLGETYLGSRGIYLLQKEDTIKYHPKVLNMETKKFLPALLCKVQKKPDGPLVAIHRIFLRPDGSGKADVNNPKMALGAIEGAAIWFGNPCEQLCIVEGPENALAVRSLGFRFVCSTINSANFCGLVVPKGVTEIVLFPDPDEAGILANRKAYKTYTQHIKKVRTVWPPKKEDNPKWDWADELKSRGIDE